MIKQRSNPILMLEMKVVILCSSMNCSQSYSTNTNRDVTISDKKKEAIDKFLNSFYTLLLGDSEERSNPSNVYKYQHTVFRLLDENKGYKDSEEE